MTWDALNKDKPKIANSVDGYVRTEKEETQLNKHFANVFKDDEGKKILHYLQSITTEAVAGPNVTSNQLFHIEGMRFLVGIIKTRKKKGEQDGR